MRFDVSALGPIAAELGVSFQTEPYQVRGQAVYATDLITANGDTLRLVLWPSIGRVDAYAGRATMILKNVDLVDIYQGVEVTFRRRGGGFLFITRAGQAYIAV